MKLKKTSITGLTSMGFVLILLTQFHVFSVISYREMCTLWLVQHQATLRNVTPTTYAITGFIAKEDQEIIITENVTVNQGLTSNKRSTRLYSQNMVPMFHFYPYYLLPPILISKDKGRYLGPSKSVQTSTRERSLR